MTFLNYPWPYLITAAFAALLTFYVHKQPHRPGAYWFGRLMGVYLIWPLAAALSTVAVSIPLLYALFVLQSVCALVVAALELMVVLEYTGYERWIARRVLLLLFLPPLLLAVVAVAFPQIFASLEFRSGFPIFTARPPLKWGFFVYVAIVFSIGCGALLTRLVRAPAFWGPLLLLMAGLIIPVVAYALIRPQWITVPPIQAGVLLTNFTLLAYFVALYSFRILQVIPVARDMLIARMPYQMIVLDSENQLVDFNTAAQSMPGLQGKLVRRRPASQVLGSWWDRLGPLIGQEHISQDFTIGRRMFHVTSRALLQSNGWRMGQVFLVEDVTQAHQAQQQKEQALRSLAAMQERENLARELHDSLGQSLAAARLQASTAKFFLARGKLAETDKCLDQMVNMAVSAEVDVREYLLGAKIALSPDQRFFDALRRYVDQFSQHYSLPVALSVSPPIEEQGLPTAAEVQLMRIIQEALSNIRKHAGAKTVRVDFTVSAGQLAVAISDDGVGFDAGAAAGQTEGFGLYSMRERAELLGGHLEVISHPGQGTRVLVQFPLALPAELPFVVAEELDEAVVSG